MSRIGDTTQRPGLAERAAHTVHCGSTGPTDCRDCAAAHRADTLRLLAASKVGTGRRNTAPRPSPGLVVCGQDLAACPACGAPLRLLHGWPVDASGGIDCPAGGLHDITHETTGEGNGHA